MVKVNIKPLSVNKAWQGKRFKTKEYSNYEKECLLLLPAMKVSCEACLKIELLLYFSNKSSDIDNPVKLILDILQKKYGFNDSQIWILFVTKIIVTKGKECFEFRITEI